jgi:hypothetical protein
MRKNAFCDFFQRRITSRILSAFRLRTPYTRALEEEVARLRAENRALVNSILGVAGIPPMRAAAAAQTSVPAVARTAAAVQMRSTGAGRELQGTAPIRRRSWQQIGRALEIEDARAARRERESDTETFPAPRKAVVRERL